MPVVSMLMRLMMGWVQILATPGRLTAASSAPMSVSRVIPGRHADSGFRCMTVSVMFSGAGSVDVSARAIFATTEATSGNCPMMAFCFFVIAMACAREMAGSVTGINIKSPSLSGGMNSRPIRGRSDTAPANTRTAAVIVTSAVVERPAKQRTIDPDERPEHRVPPLAMHRAAE